MHVRVRLLDCDGGRSVQGVFTTDAQGTTQLVVDVEIREPEMYDLGEPLLGVILRAYEAGVTDERSGKV